jgi:hypothetical protein
MVMDRTTLVRAMKPLQRDGLVVTDSAEHDGRTYEFSLSKNGEKTFDQAAVAWRPAKFLFELILCRAPGHCVQNCLISPNSKPGCEAPWRVVAFLCVHTHLLTG